VLGLQPPHEAFRSVRADAERALALNDAAPEAHIALGEVCRFFEWDWTAAEASHRRAIALAPDHAAAHQFTRCCCLCSRAMRRRWPKSRSPGSVIRCRAGECVDFLHLVRGAPTRPGRRGRLESARARLECPSPTCCSGARMRVGEPRKAIASLTTAALIGARPCHRSQSGLCTRASAPRTRRGECWMH
jgi:hypothetical protein